MYLYLHIYVHKKSIRIYQSSQVTIQSEMQGESLRGTYIKILTSSGEFRRTWIGLLRTYKYKHIYVYTGWLKSFESDTL